MVWEVSCILVTAMSLFLSWIIPLFVCLLTCKKRIITVPTYLNCYWTYYCISVPFLFLSLRWKFMNPYTMMNLVKLSSHLVELFKCAESSQARFFSLFLHLFLLPFLKNLWFIDFVVVVYIIGILYWDYQ